MIDEFTIKSSLPIMIMIFNCSFRSFCCFVLFPFFSRTNGMNSNEYFKSVSYESIQTVFIMKQISGPLPRYEYQAFLLSLVLKSPF